MFLRPMSRVDGAGAAYCVLLISVVVRGRGVPGVRVRDAKAVVAAGDDDAGDEDEGEGELV